MRTAGLLAAAIIVVAYIGCQQVGRPEDNAELAKVNAELAAMKLELAEVRAELAKAKADIDAALRERTIETQLPDVKGTQPLSNETVVIDVIEDGKYKVQEEQWDTEQLTAFLHEEYARNPNSAVLIRGDAKLEFRCIVKVMSLCQSVGLHDCSVAMIETE